MSRPRPRRGRRRPCSSWLAWGLVGFVLASAGLAGATWALWQHSAQVAGAEAPSEAVVFQLLDADGRVLDAADAADPVLRLSFGPAEAAAMRTAVVDGQASFARAVTVRSEAHGVMGLDYTVTLPDLTASGYGAELRLRPVDAPSDCRPDPAPQPELDRVSALSPAYAADKLDQRTYCLSALFEAPQTYVNTAQVSAPRAETKSDQWHAFIVPDPAAEPTVVVEFTAQPHPLGA